MNRMNRNVFQRACALLGLAGVAAGAAMTSLPAAAQSGNQQGGQSQSSSQIYQAHLVVTTWTSRTRGIDYAQQLNVQGTTIGRNAVIFYESAFGHFPYAGPHMTDNAAFMQRHLAKVAADVAAKIPDPNFNGYAVIDYEFWYPTWSRTANNRSNLALDARDTDFKDDWEEHIRATRPQVIAGLSGDAKERALASTYNQAAQKFFLDTLREAKRVRPNAKWGFYGFPSREYYVTLPAFKTRWQAHHDNELGWMFDAVDVLYPSVYQLMKLVEDREPTRNTSENSPAQNAEYILANVRESVRVSRGKPVVPFVHYRYHPNAGRELDGQWVPATSIRQQMTLPKEAGAQGVLVWDCIESEQQFRDLQRLLTQVAAPAVDPIAVLPGANSNSSRLANGRSVQPVRAAKPAVAVTRLPNGQIVVSSSKKPTQVANVPPQ